MITNINEQGNGWDLLKSGEIKIEPVKSTPVKDTPKSGDQSTSGSKVKPKIPTPKKPEQPDNNKDIKVTTTAPIPASKSEFINQWKDTAIQHMVKYGIPASITLAQAGLESGWGRSGLTTKYNNYFGITGTYKGKSVKLKNKKGELFTWRVYDTPEQSFEDHSDLLKRRYKPKTKNATYVDWAKSLTARGYAESNYGSSLINIIKTYGLDKYDNNAKYLSDKQLKYHKIITAAYEDMLNVITNKPEIYFKQYSGYLNDDEEGAAKWLTSAFNSEYDKNFKQFYKNAHPNDQKNIDNLRSIVQQVNVMILTKKTGTMDVKFRYFDQNKLTWKTQNLQFKWNYL